MFERMFEWKWFYAAYSSRRDWGVGFDFAGQKDYAFASFRILKWQFEIQWDRDYVRS